jgi:hypothetical protein
MRRRIERTSHENRLGVAGRHGRFRFPVRRYVPVDEHRHRANQVADLATTETVVERIERDVGFQDETVRGKYWRGIGLIEVGTDSDDFPGVQAGVVLAHEVGHAFYDAWTPDSGIEKHARLFRTTDEQEQARALSERLHGPMIGTDGPFVDYREGSDEELAAAVFASRIIEPMAAQRITPDAVGRLEEVFGSLSDELF